MPVRILKSSLRTSERWHRTRYFDRCFYISLLNLVDDYGRYEGNPTLLASECFPYGDENGLPVTAHAIDGVLRSLAAKDLVVVYKLTDKQYVAFTRWDERIRSKPKYPDPNDQQCEIVWKSDKGWQPPTIAGKCQQMTAYPPTPTPTPTPTPSPTPSPQPASVRVSDSIEAKKQDFERTAAFEQLQAVLCELYKRPIRIFGVSSEEYHLLAELSRRPTVKQEWNEIKGFNARMPAKDRRYFPQTAVRLLQNWDQTLDRARNYQPDIAHRTLAENQLDRAIKDAYK